VQEDFLKNAEASRLFMEDYNTISELFLMAELREMNGF
jgi:hypothetical protein